MPFCFTQIAPFEYPYANKRAAYLREQQSISLKRIKNASMAVTIDIGEKSVIHPRNKQEVSKRLAWGALALGYGRQIEYQSPEYVSHEVDGGRIIIHVSNAEQGLHIHKPEEAIAVSSPEVPRPIAVRYCFKDYQPGFLFNSYGLPLAPFRSDNWDDAQGPVFWW